MSIKKIVAREGLILLGVILLSGLIFSISSIYPPYFKPQEISKTVVLTRDQFNTFENKGVSFEQMVTLSKGQYPADITTRIGAGGTLTDEDIEKIDMIDKARAELDRRTDEKRNKIRWNGLGILLIGYALYVIPISFSIWAIRTLREEK